MAKDKQEGKRIAVIAVRGVVKAPFEVKHTLALLHLHRKNHCVVLENTPSLLGMVRAVKDYVTWGEISDEVYRELLQKRGKAYKGRETDTKEKYSYTHLFREGGEQGKLYRKYFRLNPPRKGFGRKGIKVQFAAGGALGYRGEKINELVRRML